MTVALVVLFGLVGWLVWEFCTAPTVPTFEEHTADALGLLDPPPVAVAALCPDDPSLLAVEVEQWLREGAPGV